MCSRQRRSLTKRTLLVYLGDLSHLPQLRRYVSRLRRNDNSVLLERTDAEHSYFIATIKLTYLSGVQTIAL